MSRSSNHFLKKIIIIFFICLTAILTFIFFSNLGELKTTSKPTLEIDNYSQEISFDKLLTLGLDTESAKEILKLAIPVLGVEEQTAVVYLFTNPLDLIDLLAESLVNIRIRDPINIFEAELPLHMLKHELPSFAEQEDLSVEEQEYSVEIEIEGLSITEERQAFELELEEREQLEQRAEFYANNLVGIYHSHTSESYEDGASVFDFRSSPGEKGDIVKVGQELARALESKHEIKTIQSREVTDQIYRESYLRSREVAQDLVEENQNLRMLFDVHRDAIATKNESIIRTTIDGEEVARIMLLVTRTEPGFELSHPEWRRNLDFANKLADQMEEMYPGLLRQVKVVDNRRYNQDLHPQSLLLEIGDVNNTLPEAKRSARLLADVIAVLLEKELDMK